MCSIFLKFLFVSQLSLPLGKTAGKEKLMTARIKEKENEEINDHKDDGETKRDLKK